MLLPQEKIQTLLHETSRTEYLYFVYFVSLLFSTFASSCSFVKYVMWSLAKLTFSSWYFVVVGTTLRT